MFRNRWPNGEHLELEVDSSTKKGDLERRFPFGGTTSQFRFRMYNMPILVRGLQEDMFFFRVMPWIMC